MRRLLLAAILMVVTAIINPQDRHPNGWYRTQYNTGELSFYNCGPAVIAMLAHWYNPEYTEEDVTVEHVRAWLGNPYGNGDTPVSMMEIAFMNYGVFFSNLYLRNGPQHIDYLITTHKSVIVVMIRPVGISAGNKENRYGRGYSNLTTGHWIVIHGIVGEYYAVHDPMLWGRNRLYKKTEVIAALKTKEAFEIINPKDVLIWKIQ